MDPLRDRIFGLLSDLCGSQADLSPDGLRLLSHTLLGVARDHAPSALFAVRDALPWIAAFVELNDGTQPDAVAEMLTARNVVRALDQRTLSARLEATMAVRDGVFEETSVDTRRSKTLRDLALLDQRLVDLSMRSDSTIRDTLIEDPVLLAAAVSICAGGAQTEVARRFRTALLVDDVVLDPAPLGLLCELQSTWDGGALCSRTGFTERARRFELSACDHLHQSGLAPAVRAALLYSGFPGRDAREKLREFSVFANDRPLEDLALALIAHRGDVLDYLGGRTPLRAMEGWIRYLRTECHEFAGERDISIREATSFAHFCLHLMNFCDLASRTDGAANDDARFAMMHVEDDLKDFALDGQRAGLSDADAHLGCRERERWATITARAQLLERLGRLGGGWRTGLLPSVEGAALLEEHETAPWCEAVDELEPSDELIRTLNTTLATHLIHGAEIFEIARPRHALRLLIMAAYAANGTLALDFGTAVRWFRDSDRRLEAERMLDLVDDALLRYRSNASCGFVAERQATGVRISVRRHAEFEALLVLLESRETPLLMREMARKRIAELAAVVPAELPERRPRMAHPTPVVHAVS